MKPEELADLIGRLRQAGQNFPTLRMLTDDAEEALRRVAKLEAAIEDAAKILDLMGCVTASHTARQALTGEA